MTATRGNQRTIMTETRGAIMTATRGNQRTIMTETRGNQGAIMPKIGKDMPFMSKDTQASESEKDLLFMAEDVHAPKIKKDMLFMAGDTHEQQTPLYKEKTGEGFTFYEFSYKHTQAPTRRAHAHQTQTTGSSRGRRSDGTVGRSTAMAEGQRIRRAAAGR